MRHRPEQEADLLFYKVMKLQEEIERLREAIRLDIHDAKAACGGDGMGCDAFRPYYGDDVERRYRKCGQCPMDSLSSVREAVAVDMEEA